MRFMGALGGACSLALAGCGGVACPDPLINVDGMCLKLDPVVEVERCDGARVLVALGRYTFHLLNIRVGSDLVPTVVETQALRDDWCQGTDFGVYYLPLHPRGVVSAPRFLGYRDLITFLI